MNNENEEVSKMKFEQKVVIKIHNGMATRDLIERINPSVDIVSFNEVVPSMNDIFIRVVEETKVAGKA